MLLGFAQVTLLCWETMQIQVWHETRIWWFYGQFAKQQKMRNFVALAINLSDNYIVFDLDALKNFCTLL